MKLIENNAKQVGWVLFALPVVFIVWSVLELVFGSNDSIAHTLALEVSERLLMLFLALSVLNWYDAIKGYRKHDQLPANYLAGRIIAAAIILSFGGLG